MPIVLKGLTEPAGPPLQLLCQEIADLDELVRGARLSQVTLVVSLTHAEDCDELRELLATLRWCLPQASVENE